MSKEKNILPNDDELMNYVQGNSLPENAHLIEEEMFNSSFVNDAVEGLQSFHNKKNISHIVEQLNAQLHRQTQKNKSKKNQRKLKDFGWIIITAAIIIGLCLLGYFVLRMLNKN
jgi:hypothetical protein